MSRRSYTERFVIREKWSNIGQLKTKNENFFIMHCKKKKEIQCIFLIALGFLQKLKSYRAIQQLFFMYYIIISSILNYLLV